MSPFALDDKVAVVTGALGLLGRRHCAALSRAGARVVALDLDGEACSALAAGLPTPSIGLAADVCRPDALEHALERALEAFDRVDVLVNNAAVDDRFEPGPERLERSRFEAYPLEQWTRLLAVNVTGVFLCSQVFGTRLARQGSGSIVNVASTYGIVAPDQSLYRGADGEQQFFKGPAYPTTKGAVLSLTRYLAAYWGESGVRVNALSPGGVENGQPRDFVERYARRTPRGRMARPTDFEGALVFLASDASDYVTGANLVVDGGWTAW